MATPTGAEHRDLEQRLRDLETKTRDLATTILRRQPIDSAIAQYDLNSTNLPTATFTEIVSAHQSIAVPDGYTRAQVLLFVSAGATMTGQGNVGVQPYVGFAAGPAISNGTPGAGAVSVGSFMARNLANLDTVDSFDLRLYAYAGSSVGVTDGSGNVHLSAAVTFLR